MAIDTKPNFSSNKFEQCTGDTMNLSGCTQIFGYFDMESGSTLSICANAGDGKVLTSSASGVGTWQTPAAQGITALSGGSGMNFSPITSTGSVVLGTPTSITSGSTNVSSGTTHNHAFTSSSFVTGTQGILVDGNNRFYLDDTYITNQTLPSIYSYSGISANQSIGALPSGQTLGMVYITNTGSTTGYFNLGTTPTGSDITPYITIQADPGEDVSVTVNMRLSLTANTTIYVSSDDWTNVGINLQWANITYQNASTTINPGDLPVATETTLGAISVGDGLSVDGAGHLCATGGTGGGTITGGSNGLSTSGANIILGGALSATTNICAVDGTSLTFTDNRTTKSGMLYGGDYSANYTCLSIPNVGYVTGLTSGGSGGFLGLVTKATVEPTDLQENQWVKPQPMPTDCFNYVFDNFTDSGSTAISVNLSLEDVYLRYCETGTSAGYWIKEGYSKPLTSGHTWVGDSTCKVCEIPIINEWVSSLSLVCYTGQKFSYPTQTIFQVDIGTCVTIPNKIWISGIDLTTVGDTCLFSIPAGMTAMFNSAKLVFLNNASPDSFTISIGNNTCGTPSLSFNNIMVNCAIDDVLNKEVCEFLPTQTNAVACDGSCLGTDVYFRVQSAASGATLNANLLFEGYVY